MTRKPGSQAPAFTEALGTVVSRLLDAAEALYRRADDGIAGLPRACRPGIRAARLLYAEIGNDLARTGFNSVSRRTVVPSARKLAGCSAAPWRGRESRARQSAVPRRDASSYRTLGRQSPRRRPRPTACDGGISVGKRCG